VSHRFNIGLLAIATVLLIRWLSMAWIPLIDTSEPRYAEIARLMLVSGDYITPWFEPGVPFWGKPPLSFWSEALAMKWLGVNEFAVRFPSWIVTVLTVFLIYVFTKTFFSRETARLASLIYVSSGLVFLSAGAVITDPFLTLGITLSLVAFPLAIKTGQQHWRYGFFIGLAIGLLAKGPLAPVLTAGCIIGWLLLQKERLLLLKALPWTSGLLLTAALSLPWYIAAELKTPGFLNYFIVGEHFMRFVDSGWNGDLYGHAHKRPYGTIWLYWFASSLPWSLIAPVALISALRKKSTFQPTDFPYTGVYLALWALSTPIFFTPAGNILHTYVQPSLPAVSIGVAVLLVSTYPRSIKAFHMTGLIFTLLYTLAIFSTQYKSTANKSEKSLISFVNEHARHGEALVYLDHRPYSARFYSKGTALLTRIEDLPAFLIEQQEDIYLAVPRERYDELHQVLPQSLPTLYENKRYVLVKLKATSNAESSQSTDTGKDS